MGLQLSLHGSFGELLDQRGQDAAFTGEVFALTQSFEHHLGQSAGQLLFFRLSNLLGFGSD